MPACAKCSKLQSKLNVGDLCKECFNPSSASINNSDGNNDGIVEISDTLLNASLSEINGLQLVSIIEATNNKLREEIRADITKEVHILQNRVSLLETENADLQEHVGILTSIIVNMQNSLNFVDGDKRNKNVIVSGLMEGDMNGLDNNDDNISGDKNKLCILLNKLDVADLNDDVLNNIKHSRIGKERPGFHRLIKVELPTSHIRNDILKNTSKLKTLSAPWDKIYIKKDLHPVYLKENQRLYKKMVELKAKDENKEKEVKIMKGKLLVDGVVVDKNTFFV